MEYTYEAVAVLSMFSRSCGGLACSESQEIDRYSLLNGFNSSINNLVLILVAIVIGWMETEEAIAFNGKTLQMNSSPTFSWMEVGVFTVLTSFLSLVLPL